MMGTVSWRTFPGLSRRTPTQARHWVHQELNSWDVCIPEIETAELIVAELASNAVRHAPGPTVRVVLVRTSSTLTVTVTDRGGLAGRKLGFVNLEAGLEAESGRGLFLVGLSSARWSWYYTQTGTAVWAQIDADRRP
ncbi:ATP-binding protein [Streptomyces sp. NPDC056987]|uniref:ATP-binding protein n=1 Tax=Streptomyces sp. NPDC056987 TaxID=3345988 RepID=UPI00362AAD7E